MQKVSQEEREWERDREREDSSFYQKSVLMITHSHGDGINPFPRAEFLQPNHRERSPPPDAVCCTGDLGSNSPTLGTH
jgi:hypothetical protein